MWPSLNLSYFDFSIYNAKNSTHKNIKNGSFIEKRMINTLKQCSIQLVYNPKKYFKQF